MPLHVRPKDHRASAQRAFLDEFLMLPCRNIKWHEDLLVARVAEIPPFNLRGLCIGPVMVTVARVIGHRCMAPEDRPSFLRPGVERPCMPCEYYRRGGATGLRVPACLVSHGRGRSCLAGQLFRLGLSSNLQDTAVTATNFPLEARELAVVALRGSGRLLLWAVRSRASGIPDDWQARSHLSPFFRGTAGGATNGSAIRLIGRLSPGKRLPKCRWPS